MDEQQARKKITRWAAQRYQQAGEPLPTVEVISMAYNQQCEWWEAELSVSSSADNPIVTFWQSDAPGYGLQVQVE